MCATLAPVDVRLASPCEQKGRERFTLKSFTEVTSRHGAGCSTCASHLDNVVRGEGGVRVMPHNKLSGCVARLLSTTTSVVPNES